MANYREFTPRMAVADLLETSLFKTLGDGLLVFRDYNETCQMAVCFNGAFIGSGSFELEPLGYEPKVFLTELVPKRPETPNQKKRVVICHCGNRLNSKGFLYCTTEGELGCNKCLKVINYNTRYLYEKQKRIVKKEGLTDE